MGVGYLAYNIMYNCIQTADDILSFDVVTIAVKIFIYFSIYTIYSMYTMRTERLMEFCDFVGQNYYAIQYWIIQKFITKMEKYWKYMTLFEKK